MDNLTRWIGCGAAAVGTLALTACQSSDARDGPFGGVQVAETAQSGLSGSDTTAQAVWEHLQDVSYASSWERWPGTAPFYDGGDPHGMLLTTYVNVAASYGIPPLSLGSYDAMPLGAVIVKENYQPDSTLAAVTVMYKADGYDPVHNDWFWMKRLPDGSVEASGRVGACIDCHEDGADYLLSDLAVSPPAQ